MKVSRMSTAAAATVAAATSCWLLSPAPARPTVAQAHAGGTHLLSQLPVAFVPNLGQWQHPARFVARIGAMTVFLEATGWTLACVERGAGKELPRLPAAAAGGALARGGAVRMTFAGARPCTLDAENRLPGRHHYLLGDDPSRWRCDVPLHAAVRYRDVYSGIDVRARERDGHFEYDLLLQPHADLAAVEIEVEGTERLRLDDDGAVLLETDVGPLRMPAPATWEEGPAGEKHVTVCRYVLRGEQRIGFAVAGRRPGWAMVVDPGIVWSTFLGGTNGDFAHALALDAQGAATVAGSTQAIDFPTTPGAFDTSFNGGVPLPSDAFVTRLAPTGASLVYSTFLGGMGNEVAYALVLDAQGATTVAGQTGSPDFPTTPGAFDTTYNGGPFGSDAFVTRLSPTGSSLVYSTLLGGTTYDLAFALAVDAQGAATVAGQTSSPDFPTTPGAFDTTYNGGGLYGDGDAFVARLSPAGSSLVYSTFLGGSEGALGLAIDALGATTVAGGTESADFPTTAGAFDTRLDGLTDAFVARLSPAGSGLVYSTFLGGTRFDYGYALVLGAQGTTTVVGETASPEFPTTAGAFDTSHNGSTDAFVAQLSATGSSLAYATFLGGGNGDRIRAVALDTRGAATVAGSTGSVDFPTTPGAFATTFNGGTPQFGGDAFVARLSPTGASLVYATFLGGTLNETAHAVAIDAEGGAVVAGNSNSADFPTTPGAFDSTPNGSYDATVTRLDLLPTGVSAFGRSSPGCTGPLAISVTSMPRVGNGSFALTCGNAPPSVAGLLAVTGNRLASPVRILGTELWLDPSLLFVPLTARSNQVGSCAAAMPIPGDPALAGARLFAQFFWAGPSSPPPCPPQGLSASHALAITLQP